MVIILLAEGFEELEALSPLDILRRENIDVKTVGIKSKTVTGSHGITVIADLTPEEVDLNEVELAIFPGGMPGTLNLDASVFTNEVISSVTSRGCMLAAICAAPLILGRRGLLMGKRAICFPGFENELKGAIISSRGVETDGLITTAKDYAHAFEFGHTLAKEIKLFRGEN